MKRLCPFVLAGLCLLLNGCASPDVKYSDLRPATTATIAGDEVIIHVGSDLIASACWTRPKVKVVGRTVYVVGYRTIREQRRDFTTRISPSPNSEAPSVIWVDPDGSKVPVPLEK